jgi:hypothetical protein
VDRLKAVRLVGTYISEQFKRRSINNPVSEFSETGFLLGEREKRLSCYNSIKNLPLPDERDKIWGSYGLVAENFRGNNLQICIYNIMV